MFPIPVLFLISIYLSPLVESNDIMVGRSTPFSRKIYSAIKEADPALWTRTDDIMVNAPYHDYICAVYITDLRPDKDGEAYVSAGGVGSKSVTISLRSPSVLRGYKFSIEVYAESVMSYLRNRSLGGFSGVGGYPSAAYSVNSVSYPVGGVSYPVGNVQYGNSGYSGSGYPQYGIGR